MIGFNRRILFIIVLMIQAMAMGQNAPLDPEEERKSFKIAEGWEVNLFAADPMIVKPIEMNWDNRGRLWCATSETYPQLRPGQILNDKIIILQDTAHTGRANKATVFADHLFLPTAVAPGDGGAYVTNSTELLHLHEAGTSGVAADRRVVLSGFGTEDTHHIVHTLRWGYDGRIYFNQSIYIHSHLQTPWGTKTLLGSGTWRLAPRSLQLDVVAFGMVNPWGIVFDPWGRIFETDGAGSQGVCYAFPGAAFDSAVGFDKIMSGMNGGSPKYCGEEMLDGRHIPDDYQGDILTNDFRAHRIVRFKLSPAGAGFTSQQMPDFITSTDKAFRPVDIKLGPDGAVYIADWYNPIIQHGEVDFRDPRRDHLHGRIWRVTAKGRPLVEPAKIAGEPVAALLELLKSPENYTRLRAKLEMRERGAAAVGPALADWSRKLDASNAEAERQLLEALWTYQTLDQPSAEVLSRCLAAREPRVRAAAVRVAWHWADALKDLETILSRAVEDDDPGVRLEAVRGLASAPKPNSIVIACRALDKPRDKFLDYALWETANDLKEIWLPAMQSGALSGWSRPAHLTFALEAVKSPAAVSALVEQLKAGQLPSEARGDVIDFIASIDPKGAAGTLLDLTMAKASQDHEITLRLLAALSRIAAQNKVSPPGDAAKIAGLFQSGDEPVRCGALRLAGLWKLEPLRAQIVDAARSPDVSPPVRRAALQGVAALGGAEALKLLRGLSDPPTPAAARCEAAGALTELDLQDAARRATVLLRSGVAVADIESLLGPFMQRDGGIDALAKAVGDEKIATDSARLALRYLQSLATTDSPLIDKLRASAGLASGPARLNPEQMRQTVAEVLAAGDPARGEQIFRRKETGCYQCHAINGAGGFLAPDLGSIGASSPVDYLIDSVLDPNKSVKDGYMGYIIALKSGDVINGIKVRQDAHTVVLKDNAHEEIPIAISEIRREKAVGSLMPTGLADTLTHSEFLDLIRFLSELGKPGTYGPSRATTIRRWRKLDATAAHLNGSADALPASLSSALANSPTVYSLVSGDLPMDVFSSPDEAAFAYVQGQIEVTREGNIGLSLGAFQGLKLWIDGRATELASAINVQLTRGVHDLSFRVDPRARGVLPLRVEVADGNAPAGHAEAIGGK